MHNRISPKMPALVYGLLAGALNNGLSPPICGSGSIAFGDGSE